MPVSYTHLPNTLVKIETGTNNGSKLQNSYSCSLRRRIDFLQYIWTIPGWKHKTPNMAFCNTSLKILWKKLTWKIQKVVQRTIHVKFVMNNSCAVGTVHVPSTLTFKSTCKQRALRYYDAIVWSMQCFLVS